MSSNLPRRWWQWLLMYPTIAIALLGAVPQYYQWITAAGMGIPLGWNVSEAQEQAKAWERNVGCLHDIDHIKPTSHTNYSIDLVSCPSGDILLTLTPLQNPDQQVSRWIVTKMLFSQVAYLGLLSPALAQSSAIRFAEVSSVRIIDIKTDGKTVVRRIQLSDQTCVDETIDAYTGRRLSRTEAPCTKF
jgi:hypothetical protein